MSTRPSVSVTHVTTEQLRVQQDAWLAAHPGFGPDNFVDAFRHTDGTLVESEEFFDACALFARGR